MTEQVETGVDIKPMNITVSIQYDKKGVNQYLICSKWTFALNNRNTNKDK